MMPEAQSQSPVLRVCAATFAVWSFGAQAAPAPVAPIREVVDTFHGVAVKDPYRYLESVKTPEVQAWLKGQGDAARESLDRIAIREQLEKRITELTNATGDSINTVTRMPGDRIYYLKRAKGERQFKLVMRRGLTGPEQLLVDPEVDAKRTGVPHAINYYRPSWDGAYVAYGMSAGGSEAASLYILNVKTNQLVGAPIPRVWQTKIAWLPDSKSLAYNQFKVPTPGEADSETYLDSKVMWLKVGDPEAKAKAIFGPTVTKNLGLARLDVGELILTKGSPWMIARTTDTTLQEGFLFVAPVSNIGRENIGWKKISAFADKITEVELRGNDLFFLTHANAPRKMVMKLDLQKPDLRRAVMVAVPPKDGVLEDFSLTRDAVIGAVREGTEIVLRSYKPGNASGEAIAMPFKGAAGIHAEPAYQSSDVLYSLSGWTSLARTFLLKGNTSVDSGLRVNPLLPNLPDVEIIDVKVKSHDGAMVPMTLLYKKGLKRDGTNPTLLDAYAAYGFSETARFSTSVMTWIEQGGVMAIANVRGSSVYGNDWYQAGFKATKSNTWKDGVACAKYLIAEGYASPKTLAVSGGSAGGIFAGRTATTAPELFAAVILNVGSLDTIRAEETANGITNISEFGSVKNPNEFPALLDMSTYHNIKDNTAYPAVLLVHGVNDPRVEVWHSAKATARLQAASNSGKPILLRLDMQAGHGIGSTVTQRTAMAADIYGFLLWQLGKTTLKN